MLQQMKNCIDVQRSQSKITAERSGVSDLNTACPTFSNTLSSGGQEFHLVSMCIHLSNADVFSISLPSSSPPPSLPSSYLYHNPIPALLIVSLVSFFVALFPPVPLSFPFSSSCVAIFLSLILPHILLLPIHLHPISIFMSSFVVLFLTLISHFYLFIYFSKLPPTFLWYVPFLFLLYLLINVFLLTPLFFFVLIFMFLLSLICLYSLLLFPLPSVLSILFSFLMPSCA